MGLIKVNKKSGSWIVDFFKLFDIRDLFIFSGLAMLGYGLWILRPWLGWSSVGSILLAIGLFVGKRGE